MNNIGEAAIEAILGYAVVFVGLVLLMWVIMIFGKVMSSKSENAAASQAASAPSETAKVADEPPKPSVPKAPGSAGEVMLYDTSEKDAALIMAIVADKMGKPLNELRFISIREVK